ncbi:MAG TPA: GNAT family N-acetyltransferase [Amycolatopsis sp.]|uniref:GNAT family N-acetyltransferase n=1 Tax=Amycolatopsis sp. TaxID=37632 RepID=UPI002B4663C1|nr:GNAT family N-acetyltransferase [Amycolatopsis sp.]HKS49291.1 GNAT family N-acetyltransferase [Amycolatopsis sp.]
MTITVHFERWDDFDGAKPRAEQRAELDARYGCDDHEPGVSPSAEDIAVFLVARDRKGRAVGCDALRLLGAGSAEIKRMYVVPDARGTGVAVAVLRELEFQARQRGLRTVKLETGPAQPDAIRFYEREGCLPIENFGPYRGQPLSRCYARTL